MKEKKWTIMVYLAGDNNLSENMISSLNGMQSAMKAAASDEQVNLVAIFDSVYPTVKIKTFHFTNANSDLPLNEIGKDIVEALPRKRRAKAGDVASITDFVKSVVSDSQFAAENYALLMSGHSDGILGKTMFRDSNPDSVMNLSYLGYILRIAKKSLGKNRKFAVLGFDSCMMGMLEVGCELKSAAEVLIASQGFAPVDGWNYHEILKDLTARGGNLDAREFARSIVENQIDCSKNYNAGGRSMNLSAVDLSKSDELKKSVNQLARVFNETFDDSALTDDKSAKEAEINAVVKEYVKNLIHDSHYYAQTFLHEQAVDILDFTRSLAANCELKKKEFELLYGNLSPDGNGLALQSKLKLIQEKCRAVEARVKEYVIINRACGANYQFSEGVSVFFPWTLLAFNMVYWRYKKLKFSKNVGKNVWFDFIEKYTRLTYRANGEPLFQEGLEFLSWRGDVAAANRASSFRDTEATRASTAKASTAKSESEDFYKFFGKFRNHPVYHEFVK